MINASGDIDPSDLDDWNDSTEGYVGKSGHGTLEVNGDSDLRSTIGHIGYEETATGEVTVTGAGSTWSLSHWLSGSCGLYVGQYGDGTLNIASGGTVGNSYGYVAYGSNSTGEVTVDGPDSTWSNGDRVYVGYSGSGTLSITDGGTVNVQDLYIGYAGGGTLNISGGSDLDMSDAYIGYHGDSTGVVTVTGGGSTWTPYSLEVGVDGNAILNISDGGTVESSFGPGIGNHSGSTGLVTVSGAGSTLRHTTSSATASIGGQGSGTLNITDGGRADYSSGSYIGSSSGSTGVVTVNGINSTWTNGRNLHVGNSGSGTLEITAGGSVSNGIGYIAYELGSTGEVTVSGSDSTWTNSSSLSVGHAGSGSLAIIDGGAVSSNGHGYIAYYYDSTGQVTVTGAGSKWTNSADFYVGLYGSGTLAITDGGSVTAGGVSINGKSLLAIEVSDGSLLNVGSGSGTIDNDGTVRIIAGAAPAGGATYTPISAGTWTGSGGTYEALGGTWNGTSHQFTVSEVETGTSGTPVSIDLANKQRILISDTETGWIVGASFLRMATSTMLDFTGTAIGEQALSDLEDHLDPGDAVLGAWQFTATGGYTPGDPAYLSFDVGAECSWGDLQVWHYDGADCAPYDAWDLVYDGTYASFTVAGFSGYALAPLKEIWIPGDCDGDNRVDEDDAATLAENWGQNGGWGEGDFDGDGLVGPADAAILAANWGYGTETEQNTVPEPAMLVPLLGLGVVLLGRNVGRVVTRR